MKKLIECVPNFSEGQDQKKINTILEQIKSISQVAILDVDMGADTNRTVVTMVGPPNAIAEAAKHRRRLFSNSDIYKGIPRSKAFQVWQLLRGGSNM